jgi:hypothetical protein
MNDVTIKYIHFYGAVRAVMDMAHLSNEEKLKRINDFISDVEKQIEEIMKED